MIRVYIALALLAAAYAGGFWSAWKVFASADQKATIAALQADRDRFKTLSDKQSKEAREAIQKAEEARIETDALIMELRNAPAPAASCGWRPGELSRVRRLYQIQPPDYPSN